MEELFEANYRFPPLKKSCHRLHTFYSISVSDFWARCFTQLSKFINHEAVIIVLELLASIYLSILRKVFY